MARYLLNSAVVTAPGDYRYVLVPPEAARAWYATGETPISTIGYQETADALAELLGVPVPVDRRTVTMEPGDSALVFRLAFPPGTPRIDPKDKGALGRAILAGHYELGILSRPTPVEPVQPNIVQIRRALADIWPVLRTTTKQQETITLSYRQKLSARSVCAWLIELTGLTREF